MRILKVVAKMMMFLTITSWLILLPMCGVTTAQSFKYCGTMENLSRFGAIDSLFSPSAAPTPQVHGENTGDTRAIITIPVVFHVVYNTGAQNIPDTRLIAQLSVLNKDFSRTNADAPNTPLAFAPLGINTNIQFCLASYAPNGNFTTGIIRVFTATTLFLVNDAMKFTSSGGSDAWPTNNYLNIWVCNLGNNYLGYAQFPNGPFSTDGIVLMYSAVGGPNALGTATNYQLGRVATHEVGHWLNLRHIWGDDGGACTGTDFIGDTPNQANMTWACPAFPVTDVCSPTSPGIMFMNYMDYTIDNCKNIFTSEQSIRMNAVLSNTGPRFALQSSPGCTGIQLPLPPNCTLPGGVLSYYQDFFQGGVTVAGYSPAYNQGGTGAFTTNIPPGSSIRRAFLIAGRHGAAASLTVTLNGINHTFNASNQVTYFNSPVYGGSSGVHVIDVTSGISSTLNSHILIIPPQPGPSSRYNDFALYVAFNNNSMNWTNSSMFINSCNVSPSVSYTLTFSNPISTLYPVGLSLMAGYICNSASDGEKIQLNSMINSFGGPDLNSGVCGGPLGSFAYYNNTLFGLSDDNPNQLMS